MMSFKDAMIMIGPAGVDSAHAVYNKDGRAVNNHWLRGGDGGIYVRSAGYISGELPVVDKLVDGKLETIDASSIKDLTFEIMKNSEIHKLF